MRGLEYAPQFPVYMTYLMRTLASRALNQKVVIVACGGLLQEKQTQRRNEGFSVSEKWLFEISRAQIDLGTYLLT